MEERQDLISRRVAVDVVDFECGEWRGLAKTIIMESMDVRVITIGYMKRTK